MNTTPWFPAKIKPARPGVYEVSDEDDASILRWFSYFDGTNFKWFSTCPDEAFRQRDLGTGCIVKRWRGLAEEPK